MKRKIQVLLHAFIACFIATSAFAESHTINGIKYKLEGENTVSVVKNYNDGEVTIPASVNIAGRTYSVIAINDDAFAGCEYLTAVSIPNSVTKIDHDAFRECFRLNSISIPKSVKIGERAFEDCPGTPKTR